MNTFSRLALASLSLAFVAGCAKSESQKAEDQQKQTQEVRNDADSAVADLSASMPALVTSPEPTEKWNDEELKNYEALVKKNEDNLIRVQSYNGKAGVQIAGQASLEEIRQTIVSKKQALQAARTKKGEAAAEQSKDNKVDALKAQYDRDTNFLEGEGIPTASWTVEKLKAYEDAVNRVDQALHDLQVTDGDGIITAARKKLNDGRRALVNEAKKQKS